MTESTSTVKGPPYDPPCRRIQVSREKRPLNFFLVLSKKFLATDEVIELSGLGLAVTTVVTVAELLKKSGHVTLDHVQTSLVEPHPDGHSTGPKAKIQIWIRKTSQFESLTTNHNSSNARSQPTPAAPAPDSDQAQLEAGNTNPTKERTSTHSTPAEHTPAEPEAELEATRASSATVVPVSESTSDAKMVQTPVQSTS